MRNDSPVFYLVLEEEISQNGVGNRSQHTEPAKNECIAKVGKNLKLLVESAVAEPNAEEDKAKVADSRRNSCRT